MPRHFDNWLKAYMHHTRAAESPDQFHFWTGVSTIASALRRRVWINQNEFQWTPNMYIILVGPAGVANKSTSMRSGQTLLSAIKGPKFGPSATTWQKLALLLQDALEEMTLLDKNGEPVKHKMSPLTLHVSELGTFFRMEDDAFLSLIIDMFDGQLSDLPWMYDTKTSGSVEVKNPWINLLACTTPSWLQANFPEHMIGGGLTSRIIFVYGDKKRQLVPYPSRVVKPEDHLAFKEKLVEDLQEIATMGGEMKLTEEAYEWGSQWYIDLWTTRPVHMASERYGGYISRKQTHLHKIAMVLSAAEKNELIITKENLETASKLLDAVEPHMIKVFESVGIVDEIKQENELVAFVRAYGWIDVDNLWKLCRNLMNQKTFEITLRSLVSDRFCTVQLKDGKKGLTLGPAAPTDPQAQSGVAPTAPGSGTSH